MTLLPYEHETIVLPHGKEEVERRMEAVVNPVDENGKQIYEDHQQFLFNGRIGNGRFRISKKVNVSQNFLPLIVGQIDEAPSGSIMYITYRLFFSAKMFFSFWTFFTIAFGLFFMFEKDQPTYAALAFALAALNYAVTIISFNREVKQSKEFLDEVFR